MRIRRVRPEATEDEVDHDVERQMETGEFEAVNRG
jgi:UDP-GlcNAc:undecaprenyl-phosphate GlcNAc-1-phosphate transferase